MTTPYPHHEANRRPWNAATAAHNSHKRDQAAFFRAGGSTVFPEERELLADLRGGSLVRLQCNSGQDSLSLARMGARVTGIDISDEAIAFAKRLSDASGIPATFERADLYDWLGQVPPASFDVAFASYGALCWLSDLDRWAVGVARLLKPDGRLVIMEFHPVTEMFDVRLRLRHGYFPAALSAEESEGVSDYVAIAGDALSPSGFEAGEQGFVNAHRCYEYQWPIASVLRAILSAGMVLKDYREYPFANGCPFFEGMRRDGPRWYPPDGTPSMPLMHGIVATRP